MNNFKKYLLLSLIFAALNAVVLLVFFVPKFDHPDTSGYVATIQYLSGDPEGHIFPPRILKPLPILIGVALSPVLDAKNALIVQNLVFYFLSVWLIFLLIYRIYRNEKQSFYGAVIYATAYPMLAYGLAALTDLSGWFFYLFSIWISLDFLENHKLKTAVLAGFVAGLGLLFKENVAAAPIFFSSLVFIGTRMPIKEKMKYILLYGAAFLFLPFINSIIIYKLFSYSYLNWFGIGGVLSKGFGGFYAYTPLRIIIEMGRMLLLGWIFVLAGFLREISAKNIERIKILSIFIIPSLSFLLWGFPHNRIAYIAAPLLVFLGSFGILRHYNNPKFNIFVEAVLLFMYVLINYVALEFFLRYGPIIQPPGTLFG